MADDFSELYQLAADLEKGPDVLSLYVRKAIQVTSNKVKKDAQASVQGRKNLGHAASAITYETKESSTGVSSEIGYDKGRGAGKLGNLIEFGAPNARAMMNVRGKGGKWVTVPVPGGGMKPLPPSHDLGNALLNNEEDFVYGLERARDDAMKASGL